MSSFTTPLRAEDLPDGRRRKLLEPFVYHVGKLGSGDLIEVPAGFVTDYASVPRGLWNLIPPFGRYGKAAVIHDWLYRRQDRPRDVADRVFLEAMAALGVPWWKRTLMYRAVRMFGWIPWQRRAKQLKGERS